ncbi:MAG: thioesterase [Robiginitomaculum sp.]|nr:MAG: thioesterase [Robiginitomaculum sp.]
MDAAALNAFLAREFAPVAKELTVLEADLTGLRLALEVGPQHLRPGGTVSGPSLFGLADIAVYLAILSRIGPRALAVTVNCSIDFMRKPAAGVGLVAHAKLLKLGRVLAVGDVLIYAQGLGAPVARASMTYSLPQGE